MKLISTKEFNDVYYQGKRDPGDIGFENPALTVATDALEDFYYQKI